MKVREVELMDTPFNGWCGSNQVDSDGEEYIEDSIGFGLSNLYHDSLTALNTEGKGKEPEDFYWPENALQAKRTAAEENGRWYGTSWCRYCLDEDEEVPRYIGLGNWYKLYPMSTN